MSFDTIVLGKRRAPEPGAEAAPFEGSAQLVADVTRMLATPKDSALLWRFARLQLMALGRLRDACFDGSEERVLTAVQDCELVGVKWYESRGGDSALETACAQGHLAVAQRLALLAKGTLELGASFDRACIEGHLKTAQWLAGHFRLEAADLRASGELRALRGACDQGRLPVVQWRKKAPSELFCGKAL